MSFSALRIARHGTASLRDAPLRDAAQRNAHSPSHNYHSETCRTASRCNSLPRNAD
jgi:hypothetical protein